MYDKAEYIKEFLKEIHNRGGIDKYLTFSSLDFMSAYFAYYAATTYEGMIPPSIAANLAMDAFLIHMKQSAMLAN